MLRSAVTPLGRPRVLLVHGLLMPAAAMVLLAHRLRRAGFDAQPFGYASVRGGIDEIGERLARAGTQAGSACVHFVGHSLGGLVVMAMLHRHPELRTGRVVVLGSPCTGCSAAAQLSERRFWPMLIGKALPAWRVQQGVEVARHVQIGMIAGTRRIGLGRFLVRLEGVNDGVVAVDETRLPGLADHLVMPVSHSGMLVSSRVARQVATFLATGGFERPAS